MGPAVSMDSAMGMIPLRDSSPIVGFMPTRPWFADGQMIEPFVSVPTETAVRLAAVAAPDPEDDPQGERSRTYGLRVCPPRPDQPLEEKFER